MTRRVPISTILERGLLEGGRMYASRMDVALCSVIEEALREYLSAREHDASIGLLAREPRRAGRPSRLDTIRREERQAALLKRTGRPLQTRRGSEVCGMQSAHGPRASRERPKSPITTDDFLENAPEMSPIMPTDKSH